MPIFNVDYGDDDIRIDTDEFLSECNKDEINDVMSWLSYNHYIRESDTKINQETRLPETLFREYLDAIRDNYHTLTNEDEKIITEIGKKFKI